MLRPATVVEFEMYSDEDIARWDEENELSESEKSEIKKKLSR